MRKRRAGADLQSARRFGVRNAALTALLACLVLSACGADARYLSISQLENMTKCGGGTGFPGPQADRNADHTRACVSDYGSLRINEFKNNAQRDKYVAGNVVNPITGKQGEYDFFVYGDRWAIACESTAAQNGVAEVTGGDKAP